MTGFSEYRLAEMLTGIFFGEMLIDFSIWELYNKFI